MAHQPTAAYSLRLRLLLDNVPGTLGRVATAIGAAGGNIRGLEGFEVKGAVLDEEVVVDCRDEAHQEEVKQAISTLEGVEVVEAEDRTFEMHQGGKIEVLSLAAVGDRDDLSMAYTPGVGRVCMAVHADPKRVHELTIKKNTVAIVTDGTAVLGLGDIGPEAALPVMEGKALLFKEFAGVDAFPVCLEVETVDDIVETVERVAPVFGGINLEDIAAPACFEVEERLRESLDIPVFHDDQHGTAVVTLAALSTTPSRSPASATRTSRSSSPGPEPQEWPWPTSSQRPGCPTSSAPTARAPSTRVATTSTSQSAAWPSGPTPRGARVRCRRSCLGPTCSSGVSGPGIITADDVKSMAA